MTTKEFVDKYNKITTEATKNKHIKNVIKYNYLSYAKKCNLCERIVKATYYIKNEDGTTRLHIDSTAKHMLLNLSIINTYTDIDIDFDNSIAEYDLLAENDMFNTIKKCLPELELNELQNILKMKEHDVIQNEYEPHAFISNQVERFGNLIGVSLSPALEKMVEAFENLDNEKLANIIQQIDKIDTKKVIKLFK